MTVLQPRLWWLVVAVLVWSPRTECKEFTHEDIREAMLSIVHMMRLSEDKLERHEYREKTLGDQVKRMLASIDRRLRELEPVKGMILRLDERLSNVETILLHKDERERNNQKKTNEAIESLTKSVQKLTTTVDELKPKNEIDNNLTTNEDSLQRRLDATDSKIEGVKTQIDSLKKNLNTDALRTIFREIASDVNPFEKHITDAEKLLTKYELKLNEYNGTKVPTDIVQLNEVALADEAWHSKMTEEIERQGKEVSKIQKLLSDAEGVWKQLPKLTDIQANTNRTLDAFVKATESSAETLDKSVAKVSTKIRELSDRLLATNEDIQRSLTEGNTLTERTYNRITTSYDALRDELSDSLLATNEDIQRSLTEGNTLTERTYNCITTCYDALRDEVAKQSNSEKVLLRTSEDVLSTKKRIEFEFHQLLTQVTELIVSQGKSLNGTVTDRLNAIEATIMGNQALTQVNLSKKLETEMAQVWRQIGILHADLKASKLILDKLASQTDKYVNNSTTTLGKVKSDVSMITTQMLKLNDDFNFALGELGMTTQEFRQISTGIAAAMASKNAPTTEKDPGPGPHKISSAEKTP